MLITTLSCLFALQAQSISLDVTITAQKGLLYNTDSTFLTSPYLQNVTKTGVTIMWESKFNTRLKV